MTRFATHATLLAGLAASLLAAGCAASPGPAAVVAAPAAEAPPAAAARPTYKTLGWISDLRYTFNIETQKALGVAYETLGGNAAVTGVSQGYFALRSTSNKYVCAERGGGGSLNANRDAAGPWETMKIYDLTDGELSTGDAIALRTSDDFHFWCAERGGGRELVANRDAVGPWETFRITRWNGSNTISGGDTVCLRTCNGYFVTAGPDGYVISSSTLASGPACFTLIKK